MQATNRRACLTSGAFMKPDRPTDGGVGIASAEGNADAANKAAFGENFGEGNWRESNRAFAEKQEADAAKARQGGDGGFDPSTLMVPGLGGTDVDPGRYRRRARPEVDRAASKQAADTNDLLGFATSRNSDAHEAEAQKVRDAGLQKTAQREADAQRVRDASEGKGRQHDADLASARKHSDDVAKQHRRDLEAARDRSRQVGDTRDLLEAANGDAAGDDA